MTPRKESNYGKCRRVWVNFPISGELGDTYLELKKRGIVHSTRDAFAQGLRCLHEKIVETDLKRAQLAAAKRLNRELGEELF
ncbi:hypothetical protein KEJ15_08380 [Candidatus Bathyarchaeota archaeon]|nr:hypothetical protein [Candidatus Bathyarchaeota archaeon]